MDSGQQERTLEVPTHPHGCAARSLAVEEITTEVDLRTEEGVVGPS